MSFSYRTPLRFAHCDPAGIAYYPRYFEILDAAVEDWTLVALGVSRATMHSEMALGTPMVSLNASFAAISRHGDLLDIGIVVNEVGRTSLSLAATITCGGELRFGVNFRIVLMDLTTMKAVPWRDEWRARLEAMD